MKMRERNVRIEKKMAEMKNLRQMTFAGGGKKMRIKRRKKLIR